jgi:hypothetical protein
MLLKTTMMLGEFLSVKLGDWLLRLIGLESVTKRGMRSSRENERPDNHFKPTKTHVKNL